MDNLENQGLMVLRDYAHKIGVKHPTTYVKKDLIEKIKQLERGVIDPHYSNRGRPVINVAKKEVVEKVVVDKWKLNKTDFDRVFDNFRDELYDLLTKQ